VAPCDQGVFGWTDCSTVSIIGETSMLPANCDGRPARCIKCYSASQACELMYQSALWDFYYCFRCRSWLQSSVVGKRITVLITDKSVIKSLNWNYTVNLQIQQSVPVFGPIIGSLWKRSVLFAARLHLKLFGRRSIYFALRGPREKREHT